MPTLTYFYLLIFIGVQKDIMVHTHINKLIFVRPTYGNKEELAALKLRLLLLHEISGMSPSFISQFY